VTMSGSAAQLPAREVVVVGPSVVVVDRLVVVAASAVVVVVVGADVEVVDIGVVEVVAIALEVVDVPEVSAGLQPTTSIKTNTASRRIITR
jgi:hypothetical protein